MGQIGDPKYKVGDRVSFKTKLENGSVVTLTGTVEIVDAYGTFIHNDQPYYDVSAPDVYYDSGEDALYKHLSESSLFDPKGEE